MKAPPLPSALGTARAHGPTRSAKGRGLPTLTPALAWAECALEDRERRLRLLGVRVNIGRFGLEGSS
eukprot:7617119-Alexandrium_andersonii.AAC.1